MDAKLIGASSSSAIFSPCSTGISRLSGSFAQGTWDKNYSFWIRDSRDWQNRTLAVRVSPPTVGVDETESYTLDGIRNSLIRQEDSIIFSLVERAQYCYNEETYDLDAFAMDGFHSSLVEYMVKGLKSFTERAVEETIKRRVKMKTRKYGQEVSINEDEEHSEPVYRINPILVADLYGEWIMPASPG